MAESDNASNGNNPAKIEEALAEAKSQLEKEEEELEKEISDFATQAKEIEDQILQFEEFDIQMEKKWRGFQQLHNRLFVDKLTLLFNKTSPEKTGEKIVEALKSE